MFSQYSNIRDHTLGIVFFGTPHRGSSKTSYGKLLADVASAVANIPNSKLCTSSTVTLTCSIRRLKTYISNKQGFLALFTPFSVSHKFLITTELGADFSNVNSGSFEKQ